MRTWALALPRLLRLLAPQRVYSHGTSATGRGAPATHPHDIQQNQEQVGVPMDVRPAQAEQLALAHAREQREHEPILQAVTAQAPRRTSIGWSRSPTHSDRRMLLANRPSARGRRRPEGASAVPARPSVTGPSHALEEPRLDSE